MLHSDDLEGSMVEVVLLVRSTVILDTLRYGPVRTLPSIRAAFKSHNCKGFTPQTMMALSVPSGRGGRFIIMGRPLYNMYKITLQGHYALYICGSVAFSLKKK